LPANRLRRLMEQPRHDRHPAGRATLLWRASVG
jgi:hypothetical protein